jgi:hypothetical protein
MAPSVRGPSSRISKKQATTRSNTKELKAQTLQIAIRSALEDEALKPATTDRQSVNQTSKHAPKRKHHEVQDESDSEEESTGHAVTSSKKVCRSRLGRNTHANARQTRIQLPTPPSSQRQSPVDLELSPSISFRQLSLDSQYATERAQQPLPPALQDLVSLHAAFLKAFALHIVHNGPSAPASLDSLMSSVTRLWKKHNVTTEDIQRILAVYELDVSTHFSGRLLNHQEGPFKLTMAGSEYVRYSVEYVGWGGNRTANSRWNEYNLQQLYEADVEGLWISSRNTPTCWVHGEVAHFPKLAFAVDVETQARKSKAAATRREILGLSSQAQNRSGAQFTAQTSKPSAGSGVPSQQGVKSRTLSLLDRIRAKSAATSATSETPEETLRRYAIGRIGEVVEILRMKQQRKLSSSFVPSVHSSPSKVRCKVSFSVKQLMDDVRGSLRVPLGDAELKMCFKLLEEEIPGRWLSTYTIGNVQSVTLDGSGLSGVEVKRLLERRNKMM